MNNSSKKIFDAALMFASIVNQNWQKSLHELIEKGNLSKEEGEHLAKDLEQKIAEGQQQFEGFTKTIFKTVSKSFSEKQESETTLQTDLLEERVQSLELKISLLVREITSLQDTVEQLEKNQTQV